VYLSPKLTHLAERDNTPGGGGEGGGDERERRTVLLAVGGGGGMATVAVSHGLAARTSSLASAAALASKVIEFPSVGILD
jgi:hypothetical protein